MRVDPVETMGATHDARPEPHAELESLRGLLLAPEQTRLAALESRAPTPDEVADVLPQAVLTRNGHDNQLRRALEPLIDETLRASIRRDPKSLADILFPIMGPAIRRSISAAIRGMVEGLQRVLENSLSPRSLKWRLEAMRTGRPFAEIVLLRSMLYRVEQVFLIHSKTGLLLQHVVVGGGPAPDADMVSGMLTAIQDFARDSFRVADGDALDNLALGDLAVFIERGADAYVAAVVRGQAGPELRGTFRDAVDGLHLELGPAFAAFEGDAAPFETARPTLELCLQTRERPRAQRTSPWALLVLVLAAAGLATWITVSALERGRFAALLEAVRAEPGIVVTRAEHVDGRYRIECLRDPLAADPQKHVSASGLESADVIFSCQNFQFDRGDFVLNRARRILAPPPTVTLTLEGRTLRATGLATAEWGREARLLARALTGVESYHDEGVRDPAPAALVATLTAAFDAAKIEAEQYGFSFREAKASLLPDERARLAPLVAALRKLIDAGQRLGRVFHVQVMGHADPRGGEAFNRRLSRRRAESVREALVLAGAPPLWLHAVGVGAERARGGPGVDEAKHRRVTLHVMLETTQGRPR